MFDPALLLEMNFCVRRARTDTMALHWELPPRTIFDHEILFVEDGELLLDMGGEAFHVLPGDVVLIPPRVVHSFHTVGPRRFKQPHIHLDFAYRPDFPEVYISFEVIAEDHPDAALFRENMWERLGLPPLVRLHPSVGEQIRTLIAEVIGLQTAASPYRLFTVRDRVAQILVLLLEEQELAGPKSRPQRYERLCEIVNLTLEQQIDGRFDLLLLSRSLGYSPNYISALYKRRFGLTPAGRHRQLKMERAREFLSQSDIPITEIADTLGFASISEFSRAFKRWSGHAPNRERRPKTIL